MTNLEMKAAREQRAAELRNLSKLELAKMLAPSVSVTHVARIHTKDELVESVLHRSEVVR